MFTPRVVIPPKPNIIACKNRAISIAGKDAHPAKIPTIEFKIRCTLVGPSGT